MQYFLSALEIFQEVGDNFHIKIVLNNIGAIHEKLNNNKKSLEYLFKALKIAEEISDKFGIAALYSNIGYVYHKLGNYIEAINYETLIILQARFDVSKLPDLREKFNKPSKLAEFVYKKFKGDAEAMQAFIEGFNAGATDGE